MELGLKTGVVLVRVHFTGRYEIGKVGTLSERRDGIWSGIHFTWKYQIGKVLELKYQIGEVLEPGLKRWVVFGQGYI